MIFLYILLGIALLICAILFIPFTVSLKYDGDLKTEQRLLFIKLPSKGNLLGRAIPILKDANRFLQNDKQGEKKSTAAHGKKQNVSEILEVLSLTKLLLANFLRHLRIRVAHFRIKVATGDPASTAVAYGAVNHAIAALYSLVEDTGIDKNIKRTEIKVSCDFFSDSSDADIKLSFTLHVWQVVSIVFASAISHAKNMVEKDRRKQAKKTKK